MYISSRGSPCRKAFFISSWCNNQCLAIGMDKRVLTDLHEKRCQNSLKDIWVCKDIIPIYIDEATPSKVMPFISNSDMVSERTYREIQSPQHHLQTLVASSPQRHLSHCSPSSSPKPVVSSPNPRSNLHKPLSHLHIISKTCCTSQTLTKPSHNPVAPRHPYTLC